MKKKIEPGTTLIQLDQGPEIPAPIHVGMMRAALELLTEDEIAQAVREGQESHKRRVAARKARERAGKKPMIDEDTNKHP